MDDVAAAVVHIYLRRKLICSHIDLSSYRPVLFSPWTSNWSMLAGFILITYLCAITICITCGPTLRETARMEILHGDTAIVLRVVMVVNATYVVPGLDIVACSVARFSMIHDPCLQLTPYSKHMWV